MSWRGRRFNKYGAQKYRGYASIKEHDTARALQILQAAGKIQGLQEQVNIRLIVNGQIITTYRADFVYTEEGKRVVHDAKGFQTRDFKIKWKLLQALYPDYIYRLT